MRIHLVDTNPDLVDAWRAVFAGEQDVTVAQGDILAVAHGALVSPANSGGHMDGGIDASYLAFFGHAVQERVYEAVAARPDGLLPVGVAALVRTGDLRIPYLVVAPTMAVPGEVEAVNAYRAFKAALRVVRRNASHLRDVYCPGLASGIGGVAPIEVAEEMQRALEHVRAWP